MNEVNNLPKTVPDSNLPFSVKIKGVVTGKIYTGNFIVKVPEVKDMSKIGLELAILNGGVPFEHLDTGTQLLHNGIAYLKVLLVDAPDWFISEEEMDFGLNSFDSNVAIDIFNEAQKQVGKWQKTLRGENDQKDGQKPSKKRA